MKNLTTKLVRVMAQTKRVAKNGTNAFHGYDYVTEADILESIRENLIKENVFIFSSVVGSHRDGDLTSVQVKNTIVDGDSGETMEIHSLGQGQDKGDKGAYKAYTGAMKYMILKNFLLPTGDDPEATDAEGKPTASKAAEPKKGFGFSNKKVATVKAAEVEPSGNLF